MRGDPVGPHALPGPGIGGTIPVDGHVHIHPMYGLEDFLDAAARNLAHATHHAGWPGKEPVSGSDAGSLGVLLLSESAGVDRFRELADAAREGRMIGPWSPMETRDPGAVRLRHGGARHETAETNSFPTPDLVVVAGRQIVVRERLEVLAMCTTEHIPDGGDLIETIEWVRAAGAVPVVPWGFGKWWFGRGMIIDDLVATASPGDLLLGDNGLRPRHSPEPRAFGNAEARGIAVLAGSDPLPFPAQASRPGHFGSLVPAKTFDPERPARSLAATLRDLSPDTPTFGRREPLHRFLEAQIRIRLPGR